MSRQRSSRVLRLQATAILTLFFIAVAGFAALGWWYARESPPHQGPIVLLSIDGLSTSELAAYGGTAREDAASEEPSSAIDALARDAVVFERAYTHSPLLLPAHASLLSGRLPFEHGVRDETGFVLGPEVRTLPELLRNRGFATGAFVSSYLLRRGTGLAQGFGSYAEQPREDLPAALYLLPMSQRPPYLPQTSAAGDSLEAALASAASRSGAAAVDEAERWIATRREKRHFLFLQVDVSYAEEAVARVSRLLKEQRLYDQATIVVSGPRGVGAAAASLDERTLRVPLLVKQPDMEGAGRRVAVPVQHIDLLPTMLDLVRAPIPDGLRGRSLRGLLTDADARIDLQPVYAESLASYLRFGGHPLFALTVNESRYVRGVTEQIEIADGSVPPGTDDTPAAVAAAGAPGQAPPDTIIPMRATLDRFLKGHPVAALAMVPEADREGLAIEAGYLPGLRPLPGAADVRLRDTAAQRALAQAHQRAARLVGQRRLPAAVHVLRRMAAEQPTLAAVHYQIGVLSARMGRTREAIAEFETAAALRPDAPEVPRALAAALAATGRTTDAQAQADLAVSLAQPVSAADLSAAHQLAAGIALLRKDPDLALEHADAAQAASPAVPMRAFVEGRLLTDAGRYDDAVRVLQEAASMLRQHDIALEGLHATLATALLASNRPEEAEAACREELRAFPHSAAGHAGLVRLAVARRDQDALDEALGSLLASDPTLQGYLAAVRLLADVGARERAEALRSDAQARFAGDPALARLPSRDTRR